MSNSESRPPVGYRKLLVWQKAMDFAENVNVLCDSVPRRTGFGLVAQLRDSSVSVPSNIAEGHGRPDREFARYLRIAKGSLQEAATQLELLMRRGVARTETIIQLLRDADELGAMIYGLIRSLPT